MSRDGFNMKHVFVMTNPLKNVIKILNESSSQIISIKAVAKENLLFRGLRVKLYSDICPIFGNFSQISVSHTVYI